MMYISPNYFCSPNDESIKERGSWNGPWSLTSSPHNSHEQILSTQWSIRLKREGRNQSKSNEKLWPLLMLFFFYKEIVAHHLVLCSQAKPHHHHHKSSHLFTPHITLDSLKKALFILSIKWRHNILKYNI